VTGNRKTKLQALLLLVLSAALCPVMIGQGSQKPLSNGDVIKMVKNGLPESVIVSSIESSAANFDLSPNGLISLHKAGVSQKIMDAMMAAGGSKTPAKAATASSSAGAAAARAQAPPLPRTKSKIPAVYLLQSGAWQKVDVEKAQLAQTKTKPTSMAKLAADSALLQGLQATMSSATAQVASHVGSRTAGSALGQAGSVFSGMMAQRKPKITYVWAIANPASSNVLQEDTPKFAVSFAGLPGVNAEDFEPALVKLTPAQNAFRLVGATQGKEDATSSFSADWEIYSGFLEERVKIQSQKIGNGQYQISPASALAPGEYGVVVRPVSKSKKFSGGDVARYQGEGMMFGSVWSFQVPANEN